MYWFAGVVIMLYAVLFGIAARWKKGKAPPGATQKSSVVRFFYPSAAFLYSKAEAAGCTLLRSRQVEKDLKSLHPAQRKEQLCEEYYVRKIALFLMVCLVGTLLGVAVSYSAQSGRQVEEGVIARGTYTEEPREVTLAVTLEDGEEKRFQVTVNPRGLTEEEAEILCQEFVKMLPDFILGKNSSLRQVRYPLELEETYAAYPFAVEWRSSCADVLKSSGMVEAVEEAVEVELTADISYGQLEWQECLAVTVLPPMLSHEESMEKELDSLLTESEKEGRTESVWRLPEIYGEEALSWREVVSDEGPVIAVGAVIIGVLLFVMADKDLHDELSVRRDEMKQKYPEIVQKLVLYLGAGMTVRAAFQKMAAEYERDSLAKRGVKAPKNMAVYQEINYMCRELQAGISEADAYENFGRRVGVQEYLRLSTLLVQNLKKGNSTLLQRLREESERASVEHLQSSRKLGEEASTKLLLPMVLMLLVVMLMVMLPAFSAMGV